jgi:hypothetical protein
MSHARKFLASSKKFLFKIEYFADMTWAPLPLNVLLWFGSQGGISMEE